jgi:sugar/nucleoside kinase (ribokinase family)
LNLIPDYLVIGHVTQDVVAPGTFRAGGTATYAALAAWGLGRRVGVLTSTAPDLALFPEAPAVMVQRRPAAATTTFENIYTDGHRRQYVRATAELLTRADLPTGWERAPMVHLGPIAQEVDTSLLDAFPQAILGVTPQGWLRHWDGDGLVSAVPWASAATILQRADVVVLSPEDVGGDQLQLERYRSLAKVMVLTVGCQGCIVYTEGREERVPAYLVDEVEPTGAGDVFAAAYLIRLYETRDVIEAARFANSAASFVVEGLGTSHVPTRAQVEWRLVHGQVREC